ncbi:uncharacterized protein LOC129719874 [Wyeomyia smithii]|uniref:uncharacterized protein LOC129719874 n=1 Tax=Wyeomyia smithii TaxID=174621 RepID=UPI002467D4C5|nr:uncharacterized protein LOC129719874 [Wyeomyia smithii]
MNHLLSQYRAMNTAHLTMDEMNYELKIRKLARDASRSQLERTLRNHLKEEKNQSNIAFEFVGESVVDGLMKCNETVNSIKTGLESRRSKTAPDKGFKIRLLHVLFRLERLKMYAEEEEDLNSLAIVAGDCVKLLNVYFSITSHLSEVREAEIAIINESINQALQTDENENTSRESVRQEVVEEHNEEIKNENSRENGEENVSSEEESEVEQENLPIVENTLRNKQKNITNREKQLAEENENLLVAVQQLMNRIKALENRIENGKNRKLIKTSNSTEGEENGNSSGRRNEKQTDKTDFLTWLKTRNSSMNSLETTDENKERPKAKSVASESDKSKANYSRLPVHKWSVRYDGMDNGKRLNEFLKEVEFNARSEGFTEEELLVRAHHLFSHKARSWFMEVNGNNEIGSWQELVQELKNEFSPIDMDYVYEKQANNRRQGPREKFQDYYSDMVRIFRGMSNPWDEKRKFDALFRNTRDDCRNAMLAANIMTLPKMREFGKRFDAINWQMYQRRENGYMPRTTQVEEIGQQRQCQPRREYRYTDKQQDRNNQHQKFSQEFTRNMPKKSWQNKPANGEQHNELRVTSQKQKTNLQISPQVDKQQPGPSGTSALQRIVKAYVPVKRALRISWLFNKQLPLLRSKKLLEDCSVRRASRNRKFERPHDRNNADPTEILMQLGCSRVGEEKKDSEIVEEGENCLIENEDNLSDEQNEQLAEVKILFLVASPGNFGKTDVLEHHIVLKEEYQQADPVRKNPYPWSPQIQQKIHRAVDNMIRDNIIEPSNSDWALPIVPVKKRDSEEFTPHKVIFGHEIVSRGTDHRLEKNENTNEEEKMSNMKVVSKKIWEIVTENLRKASESTKQRYDLRHKTNSPMFNIGQCIKKHSVNLRQETILTPNWALHTPSASSSPEEDLARMRYPI